MKLTILGAGAVGGVVGALLHRAGLDVTLVARGAHLEKMRADGLYVMTPEWQTHLQIPVADRVPDDTDVVLLAVKSHQTRVAMAYVPRHLPICCLQNGIGNEPMVAAMGHPTIGAMVWMPTVHLVPGEVRSHGAPGPGGIDIGAYSGEVASLVEELKSAFELAGIESAIYPDIMALKRTKLIVNIAGAVQAVCGTVPEDLWRDLMAEATAVFDAAGLPYLPIEELTERGLGVAAIKGIERPGGSTWQSLKRGLKPESRAMHKAVLDLAAAHGVDAPAIRRLTNIVHHVHAEEEAGDWSVDDLREALASGDSSPSGYAAWDITVLEGVEAARQRPGMYLSPGDGGPLGIACGLIGNALDAHLLRAATRIAVNVTPDRLVVTDDGHGIRPDRMAEQAISLTTTADRQARDAHQYNDLRGGGLGVVNAFCEEFVFASTWSGQRTQNHYARGELARTAQVEAVPGTRVELTLDRKIVRGSFRAAPIREQLMQLAALTDLDLTLNGESIPSSSLSKYVRRRVGVAGPPDHVIEGRHGDVQLSACLWFAEETEHLAFANYAEVLAGPFLVELDAMAPRPLIVGIHVQLDSYLFHGPRGSVLANPEAVDAVEALIGPVLRA